MKSSSSSTSKPSSSTSLISSSTASPSSHSRLISTDLSASFNGLDNIINDNDLDDDPVTQDESYSGKEQSSMLFTCPNCNRQFKRKPFTVHVKVCKQVFGEKPHTKDIKEKDNKESIMEIGKQEGKQNQIVGVLDNDRRQTLPHGHNNDNPSGLSSSSTINRDVDDGGTSSGTSSVAAGVNALASSKGSVAGGKSSDTNKQAKQAKWKAQSKLLREKMKRDKLNKQAVCDSEQSQQLQEMQAVQQDEKDEQATTALEGGQNEDRDQDHDEDQDEDNDHDHDHEFDDDHDATSF
jgi:hypothetical protein